MANSFNLNSIDFSTFGLIVTAEDKELVTSPRFDTITIPYVDGSILSDSYFEPRQITLACTIIGTSSSDLQSNLNSIENALTLRTDNNLVLDSNTNRFYNARISNRVVYDRIGSVVAHATLSFICKDPFAFSTTLSTDNNTIDASPKTIFITSSGDRTSHPIIFLTADSSSSSIIVEHLDREERLTWGGTMVSGDVIKIETEPTAMKISKAFAANPTDFIRSTETITGFFPLLDAGENQLQIHNFSGESSVTHRARYNN